MVIKIKTFNEIYNNIKESFYNKTKIGIAKGSVIDMFVNAVSDQFYDIHKTIEENKTPYIFTKQTGELLDETGKFISCPRLEDETDENYFARMVSWNANNASCNATSIHNKCKELELTSYANYVPYTQGIGTATIFLIPKDYDKADEAINEAVQKVSIVINPSSRVEFKVPTPQYVQLVAYLDVNDAYNEDTIKQEINLKVKEYINSVAPGSYMYIGEINKIGINIEGVEYFNVVQVYIDGEECTDFEILQVNTSETKFIFDEIIWWNVEG